MRNTKILPSWAPRVPQHKIRQFYLNDANGIYDDDLIDEVGYALLARCESFLIANDAAQGRVICPVCSATILHTAKSDEVLHCDQCGWEMGWKEYFATFQHKQLYGAEPILELFRNFVKQFPAASKLQEKVLIIDTLIHGYHWNQKYGFTRPVAINLIEGKLGDVITFLDRLTYGAQNTEGVQEIYTEWVKKGEYVRSWAFPKRESDKP
jgi:ribosomal protein L37AE/L43A